MLEAQREYTEKQRLFLEALMSEECRGNIRKAMTAAGYASNTMLAMNAPKEAFSMRDVLDDPSAMGARNSIAAAAQILDRTGLVKREQVEVKNTGGAMFILPPKSED